MRLLLDLDNTLVDRDGAFREWAQEFTASIGRGREAVDWLVEADRAGYRPRPELAEEIRVRWGIADPVEELVRGMRQGVLDHLRCYDGVLRELTALREAGATCIVVTNGGTAQQRQKLTATGLEALLDGVVVSEELGVKKPDPRIFEAALRFGTATDLAWMVGDHPAADIAGARAAGIPTAWVSHGLTWKEAWSPDLVRESTAAALGAIRSGDREGARAERGNVDRSCDAV